MFNYRGLRRPFFLFFFFCRRLQRISSEFYELPKTLITTTIRLLIVDTVGWMGNSGKEIR